MAGLQKKIQKAHDAAVPLTLLAVALERIVDATCAGVADGAACTYALDHHLGRLTEDHEHAQLLAKRLGVDPASVQTNIVILDGVNAPVVAEGAKAQGVLVSQVSPRRIRLVTNLGVDRNGAERAADVLAGLV